MFEEWLTKELFLEHAVTDLFDRLDHEIVSGIIRYGYSPNGAFLAFKERIDFFMLSEVFERRSQREKG